MVSSTNEHSLQVKSRIMVDRGTVPYHHVTIDIDIALR